MIDSVVREAEREKQIEISPIVDWQKKAAGMVISANMNQSQVEREGERESR